MVKKKALKRGLDALLGDSQLSTAGEAGSDGQLKKLPVDLIHPGEYQPRTGMDPDRLEELADSIRAQGVVQPIVVRKDGSEYELIAGERRWRASQLAGLAEIPAVVRDIPDQTAMAVALIENIQRENLNPLEEAQALRRLLDEFELTHEAAAEAVGRSRAAVSNLLRLLDLEPAVKKLVDERQLEMGHARALLALKDRAQVKAAQQVVQGGLSVRATEALVRRLTQAPSGKPPKRVDPNVTSLEQDLGERLGARVQVQASKAGKGKLVIHFFSNEELEGILEKIR